MSTKRAEPRRNTDVIRCENCGEEYSTTYKRCPFCDERPGGRSQGRGGRRSMSGGGSANPLHLFRLGVSLALIVAALIIVIKTISPMLFSPSGGHSSTGSDISSSQGSTSQTQQPGQLTALHLSATQSALQPKEEYQIIATTEPTGATASVEWSSSDPSIATVDQFGNVQNVYRGTGEAEVVITATAGGQTAQCTIRCTGDGSSSDPSSSSGNSSGTSSGTQTGGTSSGGSQSSGGTLTPNTDAVITGASGGLNIRSGPGTSYEVKASTTDGVTVTVLEAAADGWYKIKYSTGGGVYEEGYVMGTYLAPKQS